MPSKGFACQRYPKVMAEAASFDTMPAMSPASALIDGGLRRPKYGRANRQPAAAQATGRCDKG